jgi:plasmid maintenance system killer protein
MPTAPNTDEANSPQPVRQNRRAKTYRELYDDLPDEIQASAEKAFRLFLADPSHKSLRLHALRDTKKGQHHPNSFSVSINMQYRAIYFVDDDTNIWYWIGTHAEYNHFTGKS